jgi:two-component system sensor histidine kinase UhpB
MWYLGLMSLRLRVVFLIAAVLVLSMLMGTLVAGYQARQSLGAELSAGLGGAAQTVKRAFENINNSDHPERDLHQLVATFDGNRHVEATLLEANGARIVSSKTFALTPKAPGWFEALLGPSPPPIEVKIPRAVGKFHSILLIPIAEIDVGSAWQEFSGFVAVLAGFALVGLLLVYLVIGAAFRPLNALSAGFTRIGAGDHGGRVGELGPRELLGLQRGFNRMVQELAGITERNRLLTEQLLTIQEEERADIARDLHDEFGPHLFAVNMDAEMIVQLNGPDGSKLVTEQARSIQSAVGHMQRQVRDLLGRLRPTRATELGLNAAIVDLSRFWAARRPDVAFNLELLEGEDQLSEPTKDVIYRVVQEAANNAVRHGNPSTIAICMVIDETRNLVLSITDDGDASGVPTNDQGVGLIGMRERILGLGGTLSFGHIGDEGGWSVVSRFPIDPAITSRLMGEFK